MFANSLMKLCTNRGPRHSAALLQLVRAISKSSSAPNSSESLTTRQQETPAVDAPRKLLKFRKYHRTLSTLQTVSSKVKSGPSWATKEESREFMAVFPDIVRDLTEAGRHTDIPEATRWYSKVLQYNVPSGKKTRGLSLVLSYKLLEKPENLTAENVRLANIIGWCVEMLQAYFLVMDDVMDSAFTRRGSPCWHRLEGVGISAVNDALLLEQGVYSILRRHLKDHVAYVPTVELFHDVTLKTCMGQSLDMFANKGGKPNFDLFTMNKYNSIVKYKTAYYSFQLPVAVAMYMAGIFNEELHRQAKTILLEMGHFFQVQDDFLDCFGDPALIGKDGGDIREGKCSWLAVVALQRASPAQRELFVKHYGQQSDESVNIIRDLYEELGLPNTYAIYEEESYNLINTHIQQISGGLPHKLFFNFLEKIYRRLN